AWIGRVGDQEPVLGHAGDEAPERIQVLLDLRVDVDVVVLDRGDDRDLRAIVQKLRRFFEERRVVFIALDDEGQAAPARNQRVGGLALDRQRAAGRARGSKAALEVLRDPPDEKAG